MKTQFGLFFMLITLLGASCSNQNENDKKEKIPVIYDTDANNELDDQHALAYLLMNGETFNVKGVTVNATSNGGDIDNHYEEANRILKLCKRSGQIPLKKGANGSFNAIKHQTGDDRFDGSDAVNFIIEKAKSQPEGKLIVIAVGKLTNIALAVKKEPSIVHDIKLVWLGSNYPEPGEYNQANDTSSMNYLLNSSLPFEMVTVRYGQPSGTDAVRVTQEAINEKMPGKGPEIANPITGRHGDQFTNFGDYSVNLFEHIDYHGNPPSRALFDMAAMAIVKNPGWAESKTIPAPIYNEEEWEERPQNEREIIIWENFNKEKILDDFFQTMEHYNLVQ